MVGKCAEKSKPWCDREHLYKLCNLFLSHWKSSCSQWHCSVPWQCRWCVDSCCLYDREQRTGGRSLDEAACRAAGSRLLAGTLPGDRCVCSGASRRATFYYTLGHKKCLGDDTGCCCVAVSQRKGCRFSCKNKNRKQVVPSVGSGNITSCFPMHHFCVR